MSKHSITRKRSTTSAAARWAATTSPSRSKATATAKPIATSAGADGRIDAYIANSAPFARPILIHLRQLIHAACPEVHETIKWSRPFFEYHGLLCMMAAFKEHCHYALWGSLVEKGHMAAELKRLRTLEDLPPRAQMVQELKAAMARNRAGTAPVLSRPRRARAPAAIPDDLHLALAKHPAAAKVFAAFPPGRQREYIDWLLEAKREQTRAERLSQAVAWIAEGKSRNWKYQSR